MIEFKADCGHTIRAKDEDAGKAVRCAYCGKDAQVPQDEDDSLDFLFNEVARNTMRVDEAPAVPAGRRRRRRRSAGRSADSDFDVLDIAKKLAFFAVLIIAVVVIWKKVVPAVTSASRQTSASDLPPPEPEAEPQPSASKGLTALSLDSNRGGLYVNSVPPEARVLVRKKSGSKDYIWLDGSIDRSVRTERAIPLESGDYEVGVAMVISDPALMRYPGYTDVRRAIEAGDGSKEDRIAKFFLPDGARETRSAEVPGWPRLLIRLYDVKISEKQWTPLVALFLPDGSIDELIKYLPQRSAFRFDTNHVQDELTYYEVPKTDQRYLIDALERIGSVVYRKTDGGYSQFSIHLTEGWITRDVINQSRVSGSDGRSNSRN